MGVQTFIGVIRQLEARVMFQRGKGRCVTYFFDLNGIHFELLGDLVSKSDGPYFRQVLFEGDEVVVCARKILGGNWLALFLKVKGSEQIYASYDADWIRGVIIAMLAFEFMSFVALLSGVSAWIASGHIPSGAFMLVVATIPLGALLAISRLMNDIRQARQRIREFS